MLKPNIGFEVVIIFPNSKTLLKEFEPSELENITFHDWKFLKNKIKSFRFKTLFRWLELSIYNLKN